VSFSKQLVVHGSPRRRIEVDVVAVQSLDDGADADQQLLHPLLVLLLLLEDLHSLQRDLARADLPREILDVNLALFMEQAHDLEEVVLRADDLDLCHWNKHLRHPPVRPLEPSRDARRASLTRPHTRPLRPSAHR
jgi:hypothetical protein